MGKRLACGRSGTRGWGGPTSQLASLNRRLLAGAGRGVRSGPRPEACWVCCGFKDKGAASALQGRSAPAGAIAIALESARFQVHRPGSQGTTNRRRSNNCC